MDSTAFYSSAITDAQRYIKRLTGRDLALSAMRLLAAACTVVGLAFVWYDLVVLGGIIALLAIISFVVLLKVHRGIRQDLAFYKEKALVISNEINYLSGSWLPEDDGEEYTDPNHAYAVDLDVFGKKSLFHRISRTRSKASAQLLAGALANLNWHEVERKQATVESLANQMDGCLSFRAKAKGIEGSLASEGVRQWLAMPIDQPAWQRRWVQWIFTFQFSLFLAYFLIFKREELDLLVYPFLASLAYFGLMLKQIKRHHHWVDHTQKEVVIYANLVRHLADMDLQADLLKNISSTLGLKGEGDSAENALKALANLLDRLDSMNNAFGAALLNGTFLYHVHVFNAVLRWRSRYGEKMLQWFSAIHEMEMWVSFAQYSFNHPAFVLPSVREGSHFEAQDMAHPFLPANERIANSVCFSDYKLMVLTGSNMAGKSTFLRTIGTNVVLASVGLPVCALSMTLSPLELLTSMKPQDSVNENRSYFQAEIERLHMLTQRLKSNRLSLVLFDEILRGTNSADKRTGTMGFLEKLHHENIIGVIATHDIEIAEIEARYPTFFKCYYFESKHIDGELVFDYLLRRGVCSTPNATELLKKYSLI